MVSEFVFCRRREKRISTAGCGYKMAVSVTGPTANMATFFVDIWIFAMNQIAADVFKIDLGPWLIV